MIPLIPTTSTVYQAAVQLAAAFHLPVLDTLPIPFPLFILRLTPQRLELVPLHSKMNPVYVDFVHGHLGYRRHWGGGRQQALGRAMGLKPGVNPYIVDATAGLGRDAFILAWLGCHVQMIERSPVIAALLHDGLHRVNQHTELASQMKGQLFLVHQDAQAWLAQLPPHQYPEIIYLDPMYPHRQKSALVKKEMRIFREIVGEDLDATQLLETALTHAHQRVVVKRPKHASPLGEKPPHFCIQSENTRFDVYLVKA